MQFQRKEKKLLAAADGSAVSLTDVPDEAFASGILGVGFAIAPSAGRIYSPISGTVQGIVASRHAYTLLGDDGLDVLVHVGIDTVELGGEGFVCHVCEGETVRAGEPLATVDLSLLEARGYSTLIPIVITNPERIAAIDFTYGKVIGGKSETARYRLA